MAGGTENGLVGASMVPASGLLTVAMSACVEAARKREKWFVVNKVCVNWSTGGAGQVSTGWAGVYWLSRCLLSRFSGLLVQC